MNVFEFMTGSPWLSFFIACIIANAIVAILQIPFRCWNRYLRSKNIRVHGWPPAHLDGDGDFKPKDDEK